MELLNSKR